MTECKMDPQRPSNLCEASTGRTSSNVERTNSSSTVVRPSAHSHSQRDGALQPYQSPQDIRATMTSVQLRTMAAATSALQPFPNITMTPVPAHHSLHHPILQYPTALYPSINAPASNELKHLTLAQYHSVNHHSAFPTDLTKLKSPFINRNYLELAMLVCNTFRGKLFPCPHCRYVTDRRNNLKRHISTMHQACDKVLECCGVTFQTKASLREHIMIFHHNGYSCAFCGRRFCRKALLKRHLSVHSGQKDYSCPHCDYATSHKSNLERHKRIHDRIRTLDDNSNSIIDVEQLTEHNSDTAVYPLYNCGNETQTREMSRDTEIKDDVAEIDKFDEEINVTCSDVDDNDLP